MRSVGVNVEPVLVTGNLSGPFTICGALYVRAGIPIAPVEGLAQPQQLSHRLEAIACDTNDHAESDESSPRTERLISSVFFSLYFPL